jgi:hypothetical protein
MGAKAERKRRFIAAAPVGHRPQGLLTLHPRSKLKGPAPRASTMRTPPTSPMSFQKWMNWAQRAVASSVIDQ